MNDENLLPGFVRRDEYMRRVHNKSDYTGRRWQAKGELIVRYFGLSPFVDVQATLARKRGEDRPRKKPAHRTGA